MKQITVTCDSCVECPHYEPQPDINISNQEIGECLETGQLVNGLGVDDNCPFPDA